MSSIPQLSRWLFRTNDAVAWGDVSYAWDLVGDTVGFAQRKLYGRGLTGFRGKLASRTRDGIKVVGGSLDLHPSPAFINDGWGLRLLGGGSAGTWTLANTLPTFDMLADRVAAIMQYDTCKVAGWTLTGSQGLLSLSIDVLGTDRTTGVSWPSPTPPALGTTAAFQPYVVTDCTLTLNSVEYNFDTFVLSVSEGVRPKHRNSLTAIDLLEGERSISFAFAPPFTSTTAANLWRQWLTSGTSNLEIAITNGNVSDTITLNTTHFDDVDPVVDNDDEILLPMDGLICTTAASNSELTWVNDANPA